MGRDEVAAAAAFMSPSMSLVLVPLLLLAALWTLVRYIQYSNSPRTAWSQKVLALWEEIDRRLATERKTLQNSNRVEAEENDRLRAKHFDEHLARVPSDIVLTVPGIGPAVLDSLRRGGFRSLKELRDGGFQFVESIGPKRAADISLFVRNAVKEEEAQFDQAAFGPGAAFRQAAAVARAHEANRRMKSTATVQVLEKTQAYLTPMWRFAAEATFAKFLFGVSASADEFEKYQNAFIPTMQYLDQSADEVFKDLKRTQMKPDVQSGAVRSGTSRPSAAAVFPGPSEYELPPDPKRVPKGIEEYIVEVRDPPPASTPTPAKATSNREAAAAMRTAPPAPPPEDLFVKRCDALVAVLCAAGRADGRLSRAEVDVIRQLANQKLGDDPRAENLVESCLAEYNSGEINLERSLDLLKSIGKPMEAATLVADVRTVLKSSGKTNPRKAKFLQRVSDSLGVAAERLPADDEPPRKPAPAQVASAPSPPPAATTPTPTPAQVEAAQREALEIPAGVELTADLVRRQYRQLMERYNPDKARTFGPDIEKAVATKREAAVAAATALMQRWGEPLEPPQPEAPADIRHNPDLDAIFGG